MAAAERRRGRRDNGLDAADWRAIDDLDPRISEEVLDALAARGIAAYVQPAMDVDPVTRSATVPDLPSDRLYVDRQQAADARDLVRGLTGPGRAGEPDGTQPGAASITEVDATFAGIVASFDRPVDPIAASWPSAESIPGPPSPAEPPEAPDPLVPAGPVDGRHLTEPSLLDALDTFGADLPDSGEEPPEEFVPPPPPPLPRLSRQSVLGAIAVVAGLIMVIGRPSMLPLDRTSTIMLGFAMMVGGAAALILRLRPGTDPDDHIHPNDGAHV